MPEPQVTMTGPAWLRALADKLDMQHQLTYGFDESSSTARDLRQMAALWEADLSYAAGLIADEILRAERAEAALDRAANDLMLSEESFVTMRAKRDEVLSELRTTRAALERARARLDICGEVIHVLRNHDGANWRKCSARVCILNAAALSSAPEGAASDTDLTMRPRQGEAGRE